MKKAQLHLGEFSMCLMAFGRLAERSKPLPPPPVEHKFWWKINKSVEQIIKFNQN